MDSELRIIVALGLVLLCIITEWSTVVPYVMARVRSWWRRRQAAKARAHLRLINREYNPRGEAMRAFARK
jgi:cell division protein FtsW (lipid II flippase)